MDSIFLILSGYVSLDMYHSQHNTCVIEENLCVLCSQNQGSASIKQILMQYSFSYLVAGMEYTFLIRHNCNTSSLLILNGIWE